MDVTKLPFNHFIGLKYPQARGFTYADENHGF